MANLRGIAQKLWDTESELVRLQRTIADSPEHDLLQFDLMSLEKRQRNLQEEFAEVSRQEQIDVCDYRIIPETPDSYPISGIGQSLQRFQDLFSIVFDAIKTGPKSRAHIGADITAQSAFNFGYIYAGSLGFSLTIPTERLLLIESDAEQAIDSLVSILQCDSSESLRELVPTVGVASISRAHKLSAVHASYGFNTRIRWFSGRELRHDIVVHAPDYERLRELIDRTGDESEVRTTLIGRLVGLDVDTDYFHMTFPQAEDIKGKLADEFQHDDGRTVPGSYRADVIKHTRLHYSTGETDESWVLVALN